MPSRMVTDMEQMPSSDKTRILLSGWGGSFIDEWIDLYLTSLTYVSSLYKNRARLYDDMYV